MNGLVELLVNFQGVIGLLSSRLAGRGKVKSSGESKIDSPSHELVKELMKCLQGTKRPLVVPSYTFANQ